MRTPQKDCMQLLNERALFPVLNNNQSSCLSRKLYFCTASLLRYLFLQILPNDFHLLLETSITSRKRVVIVTSVVSFVYKEVYGMRFQWKYLVFRSKTLDLDRNTRYIESEIPKYQVFHTLNLKYQIFWAKYLVFQKRCEIPGF